MAYTDENLESYIQKVLHLQKEKDNKGLSADELKDIAIAMGISELDLDKAREAHNTRGHGYLKVKQYDLAVNEFQQVLILEPNNVDTLLGLASSHAGLWFKNRKESERQHAIRFAQLCLEIDPSNQHCYQLISQLKQEQGNTNSSKNELSNQQNAKVKLGKIVVIISLAIMTFSGIMVFFLFKHSQDIEAKRKTFLKRVETFMSSKNLRVSSTGAAVGTKGSVFWVISYDQKRVDGSFLRDYMLEIVNPENGKIIKSLIIKKDLKITSSYWNNPVFLKDKFYWFDNKEKDFEARDIFTGEVVENKDLLSKKFPELKIGVGEIKSFSGGWMELLTRNGEKFHYYPDSNLLLTDEEKKDYNNTDKEKWTMSYIWYISDRSETQKRLFLFKKPENPKRIFMYNYPYNHTINTKDINSPNQRNWYGELIQEVMNKTFLNGVILYEDEKLCLVRHDSEIGDKGKVLYTCVDAGGNILWENAEPDSKVLMGLRQENIATFKSQAYKNILVVSLNYLQVNNMSYPFACGLDLKSGKILWEFSPTFKE